VSRADGIRMPPRSGKTRPDPGRREQRVGVPGRPPGSSGRGPMFGGG
jgi:hypothetical protein